MPRRTKKRGVFSGMRAAVGGLAAAATAAAGGWILYSRYKVDHKLALPSALWAERKEFTSPEAGRVSYYADQSGSGRPLVLVHSVNAGASVMEMAPLFERYREARPVYALDLPGYGFSERTERTYTPELMTAAVRDLLASEVQTSADVIALSLGSEFAARAAVERPGLVHSLVMISPTGFSQSSRREANNGSQGKSQTVHGVLTNDLWEQPLFDLIATRPSIRYFLSKSFVGPVPPELIDYAYRTSHQPGAQHAPLYFLSGQLFTPSVFDRFYAAVTCPVMVIYDRDPYTSFERVPEMWEKLPNWTAERISPSLGMVHWEKFSRVIEALERFWSQGAGDSSAAPM